MKLVVIYGPPAVGKLTVAKELKKITGFRLFHNHLAFNLADSLFDREEEMDVFWSLTDDIKIRAIKAAAENDKDIIHTTCYPKEPKGSDDHIKKMVKTVEDNNGQVNFVRLFCEEGELFNRVESEERKDTRKLSNKEDLKEVLHEYDWHSEIPYVENLSIDNTSLSPKEVADKIVEYYDL